MNISKKTIVSCAVILFLVTAVAVLYVGYRGFDNYIHMAQKAKRSEAPSNLNVMRNAELDFFKTEGHYLPLDIPADDLSMSKRQPTAHSPQERLGFKPEHQLRCHYKVELTNGGADFEARARCDIDQDGIFAVYVATSEKEVEQLTDNDIY